jgi:hypothetical protein
MTNRSVMMQHCALCSRGEGCVATAAGDGLGTGSAGGKGEGSLGLELGLPALLVIAQEPLCSGPGSSLLLPSQW